MYGFSNHAYNPHLYKQWSSTYANAIITKIKKTFVRRTYIFLQAKQESERTWPKRRQVICSTDGFSVILQRTVQLAHVKLAKLRTEAQIVIKY